MKGIVVRQKVTILLQSVTITIILISSGIFINCCSFIHTYEYKIKIIIRGVHIHLNSRAICRSRNASRGKARRGREIEERRDKTEKKNKNTCLRNTSD